MPRWPVSGYQHRVPTWSHPPPVGARKIQATEPGRDARSWRSNALHRHNLVGSLVKSLADSVAWVSSLNFRHPAEEPGYECARDAAKDDERNTLYGEADHFAPAHSSSFSLKFEQLQSFAWHLLVPCW